MVTETETFDLPEGSDIVTVNTEDNTIEVEYENTPDNVVVFTDGTGCNVAIDADSKFEITQNSGSNHKFEVGTETQKDLINGWDVFNNYCKNLDYPDGYFFNKMEYMSYEEFEEEYL